MFVIPASGKTIMSGLCRDDTLMPAIVRIHSVDAAKRHRLVG